VAIAPGGAADDIKPGGEIDNTQGAVDLFGLIGSVMRPQGGNGAAPRRRPAPPPRRTPAATAPDSY
jgi:phospholipid/cholesterol/gamma-HCH transport system substrate-binding protein